jgi:hypothetical protein
MAIATIPRRTRRGAVINPADITLEVGELNRPVGVFGEYGTLALATTSKLAGRRILAQDLAGRTPVDITAEVKLDGGRLTIPGEVIRRVGLMAARPGDISDPGLVLVVDGLTRFVPKKPMTPHDFDAVPLRPVPSPDPGGPLRIHRAIWGPVYGGRDVSALVTGIIRDGGLRIDAMPEVLGRCGGGRIYQRLEVAYSCNGRSGVALAVYGDVLTLRPDGTYRTDRVNRPPPPPEEEARGQEAGGVGAGLHGRYIGKAGARTLVIVGDDGRTRIRIARKGARGPVVDLVGQASMVSETEYMVTGTNPATRAEERVEFELLADGSLRLKRTGMSVAEAVSFDRIGP